MFSDATGDDSAVTPVVGEKTDNGLPEIVEEEAT